MIREKSFENRGKKVREKMAAGNKCGSVFFFFRLIRLFLYSF